MANTNDAIRAAVEAAFPGCAAFVEGVGQKLSPFRVVVTEADGNTFEAQSTIDMDEFMTKLSAARPARLEAKSK